MSRQPPSLSYLTIYNPTIKLANPEVAKDDEDAEEQAQILFYTGKERAVSRDRILRQVGLAKALVNFAEMFNGSDTCESTHSQSRRMIMVSPEPNFWIHACVDLAKTPRQSKTKVNTKGKGKESAAQVQETVFEYHDDSVHDAALREQILAGYQDFTLLHGSFTSILETLGQTALELQLERFFTVWAWQWELEYGRHFGEHLGVPLHPAYREIVPLIDRFTELHTSEHATFLLAPPNLLPSTSLGRSQYPSALARRILHRIPPPPSPPSESPVEDDSITEKADAPVVTSGINDEEKKAPEVSAAGSKVLANPFANMDVRNLKWMWSGLTFGKNSSSSPKSSASAVTSPSRTSEALPHQPSDVPLSEEAEGANKPEFRRQVTGVEVEIDTESLQDAIESELSSARASPTSASPAPPMTMLPEHTERPEDEASATESDSRPETEEETANTTIITTEVKPEEYGLAPSTFQSPDEPKAFTQVEVQEENIPSPLTARPRDHELGDTRSLAERQPAPTFLSTPVFLPTGDQGLVTVRKRVFHATEGSLTFAVVAEEDHQIELDKLADHLHDLFKDVQETLNAAHERDSQGSILTVTKILEPQDKHIVSLGEYTISSTGFTSSSEHLFNARDVLQSDLDVLEVFSRGQNPQHWHIGRRGLDAGGEDVLWQGDREVYMEVARKESTLTDVDNELVGIVNRFIGLP